MVFYCLSPRSYAQALFDTVFVQIAIALSISSCYTALGFKRKSVLYSMLAIQLLQKEPSLKTSSLRRTGSSSTSSLKSQINIQITDENVDPNVNWEEGVLDCMQHILETLGVE